MHFLHNTPKYLIQASRWYDFDGLTFTADWALKTSVTYFQVTTYKPSYCAVLCVCVCVCVCGCGCVCVCVWVGVCVCVFICV